ncbi:hypothetical protein MIND_00693400 [Mycena indigotica]|uniref:Uncharacterized protein n=1 Tax=Mycena indigotica TaxID=2126181 RepID=A0A8H6SNX4_9AGAR|nr:uncharacterized protein MIND_00693400 [Mycena indigotica]KAF7301285.1 hypothetical protein MIND_00693400 [Mycena indigotica]
MMSLSLPLFLFSALVLRAAAAPAPAPAPALTTVLAPFPLDDNGAPLMASILGVDGAGHTTFAIAEPVLQGKSSTVGVLTATLVAGSDYASATLPVGAPGFDLQFGGACSFGPGGKAACDDGNGGTTTLDVAAVQSAIGSLSQVLDVVGPTPAPSGPAGAGKKSAGMRVRSGGVFGVAAAIGVLSAMVL